MNAQIFVKRWWWAFFLVIAGLIIFDEVSAGGCCKPVTNITNNYFDETTVVSGVTKSSLAEAVTAVAAHGSHNWDYSTQDWQGSITGGFLQGTYDENAVSFGIGKRFSKVDALFHGAFTQINSEERLVTVGGTFRF